MAMIGVRVPAEAARLLAAIPGPAEFGEPEPADQFHITLAHLGDDLTIDEIARAIEPTFAVASSTAPFVVSTSHVSTFPAHPEHRTVPIIALIDSPELHALWGILGRTLDDAGVDFSKKFPEFRPHVTLAYGKDPLIDTDKAADIHLPRPLMWGVHEIVLWGGGKGANHVVVNFPLSLGLTKAASTRLTRVDAMYRGAVRLSMHADRYGWPRG